MRTNAIAAHKNKSDPKATVRRRFIPKPNFLKPPGPFLWELAGFHLKTPDSSRIGID